LGGILRFYLIFDIFPKIGNPFRESNNAVIVLERNPTDGYSKYKIEEDNYQTLYLNLDALNNTEPNRK